MTPRSRARLHRACEGPGLATLDATAFTDYLVRMSEELHLTIRYEDAGDGWLTAQVVEIPGAISEGSTREEARENVIDALETLLTPDEHLAGEQNAADSESLTLTVTR